MTAGRYLKQELTRTIPNVLQTIRKELWAYNGLMIPTQATLTPGEEFVEQFRDDYTGKSARYRGESTDIPTVDIKTDKNGYTVGTWVIGARWSEMELNREAVARAAGLVNRAGLVDRKMMAMDKVIAEGINRATIFGDVGFNGFLNNSNVTTQIEATSPYTLTGLALYDYFRALINEFRRSARVPTSSLTLAVPPDLFFRLGAVIDTTSGMTIYKMLTDPSLGQDIGEIVEVDELDSLDLEANGVQAPGTNRDRMIIYNKDPETLLRETYPMRTTTPNALPDGLHWVVSGYQGSTEVMVKQPLRIRYYTFAQPA